jgi:hypothetical protein
VVVVAERDDGGSERERKRGCVQSGEGGQAGVVSKGVGKQKEKHRVEGKGRPCKETCVKEGDASGTERERLQKRR